MKTLVVNSLLLSVATISCANASSALPNRPNVILIMTDDQGYGDLGCLGNADIKTPNIDYLHSKSLSFSDFHVGTTSAPTRSGLMTGNYNNTTGVWHTIQGRSLLDTQEYTLADAFVSSGYSTALFGKWHLGDNYPYRPCDRGFQHTLVHGGGGVGQSPDVWDNTYFDDIYYRNGVPEQMEGYCTDVWFNETIKFIEDNKSKPFFCYLAPNAPHSPYNVEEKYAAQYRTNKNIVNPKFYGMITNLDDNVGALMEYLDKNGLSDNTIVIFMTDNGTSGGVTLDKQEFVVRGNNAGMRGKKGSNYEGGHRVPFIMHIPNVEARTINALSAHIDVMPTMVELCGLKLPKGHTFDGMSLRPLIMGKKLPNRMLCVDTQRGENMHKYQTLCVMDDKWRLVGEELYDISSDAEQRNNIADKHPERVAAMKAFYEKWWVRNSVRIDDIQYIGINPTYNNEITGHDLHTINDELPAWNQGRVRKGVLCNGEWAIEIYEDGQYEIELRRWPLSTDMALQAEMPLGRNYPNGRPAPKGVSLSIVKGELNIGTFSQSKTISLPSEEKAFKFTPKLKKGKYMLGATFTDDKGEVFAPYYIYIKKK